MEFKRDKYLDELVDKIGNSLVKVITGSRRCGKSYLMNKFFYEYLISIGVDEKHIIRFGFDNDEHIDQLDNYFSELPNKILDRRGYYVISSKKFRAYIQDKTNDKGKYYLLLDEIQLLDSFVGTLNAFLSHNNFDIYVTGSNSNLLSSEIETMFRGRKSSIHMLPLSFSEFLTGFNSNINEAWKNYIVTGGIPLVYKQSEKDRYKFLSELCNEVYIKDIIGRKGIKDSDTLNELFSFLSSSIGSSVSPLSLEKTFRSKKRVVVTDDTINNYINHFIDAFIVSKVYKYNIKGKKYINTPYKVYFEDIGVRNAKTDFKQIEETHIMENIIYNELRYRGFSVDVGEVDIYEATDRIDQNGKKIYANKKLEVDFIARLGEKKYYIQSCLNINSQDVVTREKKSLCYIDDSFRKLIITKDGLSIRKDINGFTIMDIFDFLLDYDSLDK